LLFQEEEEERSDRWKSFLDRLAECSESATNRVAMGEDEKVLDDAAAEQEADASLEISVDGHEASNQTPADSDSTTENGSQKEEVAASAETKVHRVKLWTEIRPSLHTIEDMMCIRVKKKPRPVKEERNKKGVLKDEQIIETAKSLSQSDDAKSPKGACEEDSDEEFYDVERSDPSSDAPLVDCTSASTNGIAADAAPPEASFPWNEELEVLVRGGVPMALRGEVPHYMLEVYIFSGTFYELPSCLLSCFSFGKLLWV
jgi:hypothetical protein